MRGKQKINDVALLKSELASYLRSFLDFKRAQGHRYMQGDWFVPGLDRLLHERGDTRITHETAEAWMEDAARRGPNAVCHRATFLRQFCRYLGRFDKDTFQPPPRFVPRRPAVRGQNVFSEDELRTLFAAAQKLETEPPGGFRIWLLLLYACGLRPTEGRVLSIADVNLEEGVLRVRETKFRKHRYVPMSPATLKEVREYHRHRQALSPNPDFGDHFILFSPYKNTSHSGAMRFQEICAKAGVAAHPGCRPPRPHDLRHTFAVHRLLDWYRQGGDVLGKLHLLATYMGHAEIVYTEKYLHITRELLDEAAGRFHARCAGVLEVSHD